MYCMYMTVFVWMGQKWHSIEHHANYEPKHNIQHSSYFTKQPYTRRTFNHCWQRQREMCPHRTCKKYNHKTWAQQVHQIILGSHHHWWHNSALGCYTQTMYQSNKYNNFLLFHNKTRQWQLIDCNDISMLNKHITYSTYLHKMDPFYQALNFSSPNARWTSGDCTNLSKQLKN